MALCALFFTTYIDDIWHHLMAGYKDAVIVIISGMQDRVDMSTSSSTEGGSEPNLLLRGA